MTTTTQYNSESIIQIQDNQKSQHNTAAPVSIEVFNNDTSNIDIFATPTAESERLLTADTGGNVEMARRFAETIARASHARNMFRLQEGPELLARQIIIIGQDNRLFPGRIVIPSLRIDPNAPDVIARIRATNAQQIVRGKVIRARVRARPRIESSKPVIQQKQSTNVTHKGLTTHIPARIWYNIVQDHDRDHSIIGSTSTDISYIIKSIALSSLTKNQFDTITDIHVSQHAPFQEYIRTINQTDTNKLSSLMYIYNYLRIVHNQFITARPYVHGDFESCAYDSKSDGAETIDLIPSELTDYAARVSQIASYFDIVPNYTNLTNIAGDFMLRGAYKIYIAAMLYPDDHTLSELITQIRCAAHNVVSARDNIVNMQHTHDRLIILSRIISQFTHKKTNIVIGKSKRSVRAIASEDELMQKLNASEIKLVRAQFDATMRATSQTSQCAHYNAISQLRDAVSISSITRAIERITLFMPSKPKLDTYIICARCSEPLICPHVLVQYRATMARSTPAVLRDALIPFVETISNPPTSYCKICAEVFDTTVVTHDDFARVEMENEDLSDIIFHELIVSQRYFRARLVLDQASFLRVILRHIYPFIEVIRNKLTIMQTSTLAELNAKTRIFSTIYIFADCIINMNKLNIVFDGSPTNTKIAYMIKYAVDKIMSISSVPLSVVPGFTREVINTNIITAITQLNKVASIITTEEPRDYRSVLQYDPLFALIYFKYLSRPAKGRTNSTTYQRAIFTLMKPDFVADNIYTELFAKLPKKSGDLVSELRDCYELREYAYPISGENIPQAIIKLRARIEARRAKMRAKYDTKISKLRIPIIMILRDPSTRFNYNILAPLNTVYDIQGRLHIWSIAIVDGKELSIRTPGLFARENNKLVHIISAYKCERCGATTSDAPATVKEIAAIAHSIESRDKLANFYQFYEDRCPINGIHEWKSDKCKKCGITTEIAQSLDINFYEKYAKQFADMSSYKVVNHINKNENTNDFAPINANNTFARKCIDTKSIWIFDYDIIIKTALTFKIDRRDIIMFGAKEDVSRAEMQDESYVPLVPRSRDDMRIRYIRARILDVIIYYSALFNAQSNERIRIKTVANIIESIYKAVNITGLNININKTKLKLRPLADIIASDDDLGALICSSSLSKDDNAIAIFNIIITQFANNHKPQEIVDFYIETLCKLLLAISSTKLESESNSESIYKIFSRLVWLKFIEFDNISLKHEHYNAIITDGTKLTDLMPDEDDETGIDDNISASDPFSIESFDIEDNDADEPVIRMGNDIGW
jgi:hypothetical protein